MASADMNQFEIQKELGDNLVANHKLDGKKGHSRSHRPGWGCNLLRRHLDQASHRSRRSEIRGVIAHYSDDLMELDLVDMPLSTRKSSGKGRHFQGLPTIENDPDESMDELNKPEKSIIELLEENIINLSEHDLIKLMIEMSKVEY